MHDCSCHRVIQTNLSTWMDVIGTRDASETKPATVRTIVGFLEGAYGRHQRKRLVEPAYRLALLSERYGSCSVLETMDHGRDSARGSRIHKIGHFRNNNAARINSTPFTPSRHPVVSRKTIRRRLADAGITSRRPLRRILLALHHRQCRLNFYQPRASWSVTDWRHVIFSDEF